MSRVFVSEGTGAAIYVFSDDHCPAHVHTRHRGEGWIARVKFSYVSDAVELISIAPAKNIPLQRVINRLLSDIQRRLPDRRRSWWTVRRTTCWRISGPSFRNVEGLSLSRKLRQMPSRSRKPSALRRARAFTSPFGMAQLHR